MTCDIDELAIAQIAIERILQGRCALTARRFATIQEKNIQPAVAIKIKESNAASHGFD